MHDWSLLDAGVFHDFHCAWITELRNALNGGLLPQDYFALSEQHTGPYVVDVLTMRSSPEGEARRSLAIRHVSGNRLIALIGIASPANKDRAAHVNALADKIGDALRQGVHVLLVDLFAPGPFDPRGLHGAVWELFDDVAENPPADTPLTQASYVAEREPEAYIEYHALGGNLPEMPLFLHLDRYLDVPLESTYQAAYRGTPAVYRQILEGAGS